MKNLELTKKGKIILGVLSVIIIGVVIFLVIPKNNIKGISIEIAIPNEGRIVDDPILGTTLELEINKKIKLLETIHPKKANKTKTEYVSENPEIAYVNEENMKSYTYNAGNNTSMTIVSNGTVDLSYIYSDNKMQNNNISANF